MRLSYLRSLVAVSVLLAAGRTGFGEVPPISPSAPGEAAGAGLPQVVAVVDGYLTALRTEEWARAYELLSSASKKGVSREEWVRAAEGETARWKPKEAAVAWRPLLPGADRCQMRALTFAESEARGVVEATYSLPAQVCLAKEDAGWKIDLAATDREVVRGMVNSLLSGLGPKPSDYLLSPQARVLLAPYVVSHRIDQVEIEGEKARVITVETAIVKATVRFVRRGPFWEMQLGEPLVAGPPIAEKREAGKEPEALPGPRHWRK